MSDQLPLIEAESDEALLLPPAELAKRYTAKTATRISERRDPILALIGCGWPAEEVAKVCHCSRRIVNILAAQYATQAAEGADVMARVLGRLGMKAAYYVDQKLPDAKPGEAAVIMGIALQRKQEIEAAHAGRDLTGDTLDAEVETEREKKFREAIMARLPKQITEATP